MSNSHTFPKYRSRVSTSKWMSYVYVHGKYFQMHELIVIEIDAQREEQSRVSFVYDLKIIELR